MPWHPWTCESQRAPLLSTLFDVRAATPQVIPLMVGLAEAPQFFYFIEIDLAGARAAHSFLEINLAGTFSGLFNRQGKAVLR
jgi:hypothetical protein